MDTANGVGSVAPGKAGGAVDDMNAAGEVEPAKGSGAVELENNTRNPMGMPFATMTDGRGPKPPVA